MTRNVRATDWFARWGGEEFLLVCCNSGLNETAIMAEKLRSVIAGHVFSGSIEVRASFGVATIDAHESLETLFKRADNALYEAKRQNRNCVVTAPFGQN